VYSEFIKVLVQNDFQNSILLGKVTKASQGVMNAFVQLFYSQGLIMEFLKVATTQEIVSTKDVNVIFRQNSVATKAVDQWMKLVGFSYLQKTLGFLIDLIYSSNKSCELDPTRIENGADISKNRDNLIGFVTQIWHAIRNSVQDCPTEFRELFHHIQTQVQKYFPEASITRYTSISGMLFLRFFVPAILSPKQFEIMKDHPLPEAARNLTLISKTIFLLREFGYLWEKGTIHE